MRTNEESSVLKDTSVYNMLVFGDCDDDDGGGGGSCDAAIAAVAVIVDTICCRYSIS